MLLIYCNLCFFFFFFFCFDGIAILVLRYFFFFFFFFFLTMLHVFGYYTFDEIFVYTFIFLCHLGFYLIFFLEATYFFTMLLCFYCF
jgi:hypothetical protein